MSIEKEHDLVAGDVYRVKIKKKGEKKGTKYLAIVTEFTERFGCSSGLAFNIIGYHFLFPPWNVEIESKVPSNEYGFLIEEIHEQSCTLTRWFHDKLNEEEKKNE